MMTDNVLVAEVEHSSHLHIAANKAEVIDCNTIVTYTTLVDIMKRNVAFNHYFIRQFANVPFQSRLYYAICIVLYMQVSEYYLLYNLTALLCDMRREKYITFSKQILRNHYAAAIRTFFIVGAEIFCIKKSNKITNIYET